MEVRCRLVLFVRKYPVVDKQFGATKTTFRLNGAAPDPDTLNDVLVPAISTMKPSTPWVFGILPQKR